VLKALWARAEACTPEKRAAAYTQGVMDLGATLCTRTRPACTACPMNQVCIAAREGRQAELPGAKARRARPSRETVLLIAERGEDGARAVLLERRPAPGIWGGLWSPPQFASESEALAWCRRELGDISAAESLPPIEHGFTHFDLRLNPLRVRCVRLAPGVRSAAGAQDVSGTQDAPGVQETTGARETTDRLWYPLDHPPKLGLPQPIARLIERLVTSASPPLKAA
jgi:A/G-specific adenine glycosylase